jgi:2-C-methyl-D-erythritol 4-phosphate cytidylyltransferase
MQRGEKMKSIGIILSGGTGGRFNATIPKQYMSLNGPLIIQYVINAFQESKLFDEIIIVINKQYIKLLKNVDSVQFVDAGKTRNESIQNGLNACPDDTDYVLFHDAARPFIKAEDLSQYLDALKDCDAAITSIKITDAMFPKFEDRTRHNLIQTPEAFRFKTLIEIFNKNNIDCIAIYQHLISSNIDLIELTHQNMKITYAQDLYVAEQLMKYKEVTKRISDVKNKDILIFGGTGGIGNALTKQLKELGANVISLGSLNMDLSQSYIHLEDLPKSDCIIYSAGTYTTDSEGLIANYDKIMNVNFRSIVYIVENIERLLNPGGSIIILGSTCAAFGRPGIALYSASKSALNGFVEAISPSLTKKGFRINVICPAKVATPLQKHINPDANQKEMIQPDDLAKIIIGYINIEKTGQIVYIRVGQE